MNYDKIYDLLMSKAKTRTFCNETYYEKHHIIPRCMGGSDDPQNIVLLLPEEHYLAHQLLIKMTLYKESIHWNKLVYSANMMTVGNNRNNKLYGWVKRQLSEVKSKKFKGKAQSPEHVESRRKKIQGLKRSEETKRKISEAKKGVKRNWSPSEEQKKATSERMKNYKHSEETKKKITGRIPGTPMSEEQKQLIRKQHTGKIISNETRAKMSAAAKLSWQKRKGLTNQ